MNPLLRLAIQGRMLLSMLEDLDRSAPWPDGSIPDGFAPLLECCLTDFERDRDDLWAASTELDERGYQNPSAVSELGTLSAHEFVVDLFQSMTSHVRGLTSSGVDVCGTATFPDEEIELIFSRYIKPALTGKTELILRQEVRDWRRHRWIPREESLEYYDAWTAIGRLATLENSRIRMYEGIEIPTDLRPFFEKLSMRGSLGGGRRKPLVWIRRRLFEIDWWKSHGDDEGTGPMIEAYQARYPKDKAEIGDFQNARERAKDHVPKGLWHPNYCNVGEKAGGHSPQPE